MQLGGIAPGDAGEIFRIDADDGEVVELVHSNEFRREDAAIVERDANLSCTVNDMPVGHNVAIRRNDDAAADPMLELCGRSNHLASSLRTKEPLELARHAAVLSVWPLAR